MIALAPGGGGAYTSLELPGTTARQLLVPAAIALFFRFVREPSWPVARRRSRSRAWISRSCIRRTRSSSRFRSSASRSCALLVARADLRVERGRPRRVRGAGACSSSPGCADRRARRARTIPSAAEKARGAAAVRAPISSCSSPSSYHLAPALVARTGAIAVAALVLVAARGARGAAALERARARRHGARARARALAVPLPALLRPRVALAVAARGRLRAVRVRVRGRRCGADARAAGRSCCPSRSPRGSCCSSPIRATSAPRLRARRPGGRRRGSRSGGGLAGDRASRVVLVRRGLGRYERPGLLAGLAVALFVLPVAVHGFAHWDTRAAARRERADARASSHFLRRTCPKRAVVFADLETSYRISAYAPVYVANGAADARRRHEGERPRGAARDLLRFLRPATSRSLGATAPAGSSCARTEHVRAGRAPRLP